MSHLCPIGASCLLHFDPVATVAVVTVGGLVLLWVKHSREKAAKEEEP